MNGFTSNFIILIRRVGLLLSIYFLCRLLFLVFNFTYFSSTGYNVLLRSFFYGIRYDITAIAITNVVFISLHLFPFNFFYSKIYQGILKTIFMVVNVPFILLNCIDIGLFRFTGKRSGIEIFSIMSFGNDFFNTLPNMIIDFWYILLIFFGIIYSMYKLFPSIGIIKIKPENKLIRVSHSSTGKILLFLLFTSFLFIGFRGGIQYKPLNIISASQYGTGKITTLILNTSFTVVKTFGKKKIDDIQWMSEKDATRISPVIKSPDLSAPFNPKNIVIIILESFGKEYIGSLNSYKGYTPFLDSLITKSLVFPDAYANGKRSIEGIPAIIAGIPALMPEPFITSSYSGNSITSLPTLLKSKGYSSAFFHGGTNGTMGFDNFTKSAGYEIYFGRTEYNNDIDFDGSWGIYDEPFLQRTALELNKTKTPFIASIFTISSHHPYKIPEKYSNHFPSGTLPIHISIGYADYSLKRFFESASKMNWYTNTLFVITADHTALSEYPFYRSQVGLFSIPLIFYSPGDSLLSGMNRRTTQQIDIIPSILDYINFDRPFYSLGTSVFDKKEEGFAVNLMNENYQLIHEDYSLAINSSEKNSLYKFTVDSTLKNNLSGKDSLLERKMEIKLFSIIQNFNQTMIKNQMK